MALRPWNRVQDRLAGHPDEHLRSVGDPGRQGTPHVLQTQRGTRVALQRAPHQPQRPLETPAPSPA